MIKNLPIEHGIIHHVERCEAPEMRLANGSVIANLPPRTTVKLSLHPAKGSNINVEIWLQEPKAWNSRFVGLGNGGPAGSISPENLAGPFRKGFVTASTDLGTAPNPESGIGNPEVWKDFGHRATHLMTLAAKQVIAAFYGRNPDFSYFLGGSTGGQQALQEAQRYPDDYDAILAAIPAHCRTPLHAYFLWNEQILNACKFTDSQQANILEAANEIAAPDEPPVTAGRVVSDPRCTEERIEAVIRRAREKDDTLTETHAAALRKLFSGPRHAVTGEHIFDGIPPGGSFETAQGNLYLFKWVFGADTDPMKLDFAGDMDAYTAALGPHLNADNPDLEAFARRGGKLLIYSGTSDSTVPYHATLDYYERVAERFGGIENVQTFCRYYLIPGMGHGPGEKPTSPGVNTLPDMLGLLVRWREADEAPGWIEGKRMMNGHTEWTVPIHPYPAKTGWDATAGAFTKMEGPRGGVGRVAKRFALTDGGAAPAASSGNSF